MSSDSRRKSITRVKVVRPQRNKKKIQRFGKRLSKLPNRDSLFISDSPDVPSQSQLTIGPLRRNSITADNLGWLSRRLSGLPNNGRSFHMRDRSNSINVEPESENETDQLNHRTDCDSPFGNGSNVGPESPNETDQLERRTDQLETESSFQQTVLTKLAEILVRINVLEKHSIDITVQRRLSNDSSSSASSETSQTVNFLVEKGLPAVSKEKVEWLEFELLNPDFMQSMVITKMKNRFTLHNHSKQLFYITNTHFSRTGFFTFFNWWDSGQWSGRESYPSDYTCIDFTRNIHGAVAGRANQKKIRSKSTKTYMI